MKVKNKTGMKLESAFEPAKRKRMGAWMEAGACSLILCTVLLFTPQMTMAEVAGESVFFLPEVDGFSQGYVGDCMPYYEDGVYYIYYLKDEGDSYHHAIYLTTTTDFLTYTEYDDPILEASDSPAPDEWIGPGFVVKADGSSYLFYTGHTEADSFDCS